MVRYIVCYICTLSDPPARSGDPTNPVKHVYSVIQQQPSYSAHLWLSKETKHCSCIVAVSILEFFRNSLIERQLLVDHHL